MKLILNDPAVAIPTFRAYSLLHNTLTKLRIHGVRWCQYLYCNYGYWYDTML